MATYNIGPGQTYTTFTALVATVTLQPGDIVDGGGNTFTETWTVPQSGSDGQPISFTNAAIDGSNTRSYGINTNGRHHLVLSGLSIKDATDTNFLLNGCHDSEVNGCSVSGNGIAVRSSGDTGNVNIDGMNCLNVTPAYVGAFNITTEGVTVNNTTISGTIGPAFVSSKAVSVSSTTISGGTDIAIKLNGITSGTVSLSNVAIEAPSSTGLYALNCDGLKLEINSLSVSGATGANGVYIKDSALAAGSYINDLYSHNNEYAGIFIEGSSGITLSSPRCDSNQVGINLNLATSISINGGSSILNRDDGVDFLNATTATVSGHNASYNGTSGAGITTGAGDGFSAHDTCSVTFNYCVAAHNLNTGMAHTGTSTGEINNCTIVNNGSVDDATMVRGGLYLTSTANPGWTVRNTLASGNYTYGRRCDYFEYPASHNSLNNMGWFADTSFWTTDGDTFNNFDNYLSVHTENTQYINSDPKFRSTTDFHLRSSSPCINAGVHIPGLEADFDGNKLPPNGSGFVPDIGAYDSYVGSVGTVLCGVYLPWDSSAVPETQINVLTTSYAVASTMFLGRGATDAYLARLSDGVNSPIITGNFAAGRYCIISQWSAALGKMRVGLYNPATGALTWSSQTLAGAAPYRGFFPIHSSNRLRFFYGGGPFPIGVGPMLWFDSILSDDLLIWAAREVQP